jgi:hypothetical protein
VVQECGGSRIGEQALSGDRIIGRVESSQSSQWLEISQSWVSGDTQYRGLELGSRTVNAPQKG